MKEIPLVSIIVPIYNVEDYLERCIDSLTNQTLEAIEILLIDDGSTDKSAIICENYRKIDSRIRVYHKKNGGLSSARNFGINLASSDFIGFVDGDDFIEPDMYERLLNGCIHNNALISICGRYNITKTKKIPSLTLKKGIKLDSKNAIARLLIWDGIDSSACDKIFHKSLFKNLDFPIKKYNEDIFIMVKLFHNAGSIYHIGLPKYNYVLRSNSITNQSFNVKKMDLIQASNEVVFFVKHYYKSLTIRARSFHLRNLIFLKGLFEKNYHKYSFINEKKILNREFLNSSADLVFNPFLPFLQRIKGILMVFKLYPFLVRINNYNEEPINK